MTIAQPSRSRTGSRAEQETFSPEVDRPASQEPDATPGAGAGGWQYLRSRCASMHAVEQRALRVAPADETVLILGETGVGKDMMARYVHQCSSRRDQVFVHLNCAALQENLLESELFGHMRGSYTGATDSRPGQFEMAAGGTLFLDEIGELPGRLQAKLLHVLQERKIYRVGGRQPLNVDVRVIAATNRDLAQAIRSGAFRRDLFYRLGVVTLRIPPLRERAQDLEDLARHFLRRYSGLYNRPDLSEPDEDFLRRLRTSRWEGNIRELENVVKQMVLLGGVESLEEDPAAAEATRTGAGVETRAPQTAPSAHRSLRETARLAVELAERRAMLSSLARTSWNRKQTARELQVSYRALLYKIKDYNLRPDAPLADEDWPTTSH